MPGRGRRRTHRRTRCRRVRAMRPLRDRRDGAARLGRALRAARRAVAGADAAAAGGLACARLAVPARVARDGRTGDVGVDAGGGYGQHVRAIHFLAVEWAGRRANDRAVSDAVAACASRRRCRWGVARRGAAAKDEVSTTARGRRVPQGKPAEETSEAFMDAVAGMGAVMRCLIDTLASLLHEGAAASAQVRVAPACGQVGIAGAIRTCWPRADIGTSEHSLDAVRLYHCTRVHSDPRCAPVSLHGISGACLQDFPALVLRLLLGWAPTPRPPAARKISLRRAPCPPALQAPSTAVGCAGRGLFEY